MKRMFIALLLLVYGNRVTFAAPQSIVPDASYLTIHVGKSGLLSAAGHEHTVIAPIAEGTIEDGPRAGITFQVDASRLVVQPEEHQSEIQHSMQERVLEISRFPHINFASDSVQPDGHDSWIVAGTLMLHGSSKPVRVSVRKVEGKYVGVVVIKQSDFGIQPISAAGGAVRVKNELKIDFTISTK